MILVFDYVELRKGHPVPAPAGNFVTPPSVRAMRSFNSFRRCDFFFYSFESAGNGSIPGSLCQHQCWNRRARQRTFPVPVPTGDTLQHLLLIRKLSVAMRHRLFWCLFLSVLEIWDIHDFEGRGEYEIYFWREIYRYFPLVFIVKGFEERCSVNILVIRAIWSSNIRVIGQRLDDHLCIGQLSYVVGNASKYGHNL